MARSRYTMVRYFFSMRDFQIILATRCDLKCILSINVHITMPFHSRRANFCVKERTTCCQTTPLPLQPGVMSLPVVTAFRFRLFCNSYSVVLVLVLVAYCHSDVAVIPFLISPLRNPGLCSCSCRVYVTA